MIKNIIFDIGGVLLEYNPKTYLDKLNIKEEKRKEREQREAEKKNRVKRQNIEKEIEEKEIKGKIREYKGVTYHDLKRRIKIFKIT